MGMGPRCGCVENRMTVTLELRYTNSLDAFHLHIPAVGTMAPLKKRNLCPTVEKICSYCHTFLTVNNRSAEVYLTHSKWRTRKTHT